MSEELRCSSRIHGLVMDDGELEVKCHSKRCGAGNGIVVFHYFDLGTQALIRTKKFRDAEILNNNHKEERAPCPSQPHPFRLD